ncbi:hypothetical protein NQT62_04205 [Limnobacter humi]|uniref:Uncharacterized protein n=1 Tax=Limnobacter humi TaxID=1778671 RepID=A0ABT1WDQ5_9BURK|nr:hypothetical protein [Limnobacter humi]MCQ8895645.1 hypothetical protein [Limnobacter humi]
MNLYPSLSKRDGSQWLVWLASASRHLPELGRALQFLQSASESMDAAHTVDARQLAQRLRQAGGKYIGQARCPSAASCDKIACRLDTLGAWLGQELQHGRWSVEAGEALLGLGSHVLLRVFGQCEGADDRAGVLVRSVRQFARDWLQWLDRLPQSSSERALTVYPVAMQDQLGIVEPVVWWKALATTDRVVLTGLVEEDIRGMAETQPSAAVNWRSFDKRWRRLRLKGLLEYLDEPVLLAELLRKSAVDDFEAAQAIAHLRRAGRAREAIVQAEQWMRALPKSPVLAAALFDLYMADGWDDEALALAVQQYAYDPHPDWIDRLACLNTPAARAQTAIWRQQV